MDSSILLTGLGVVVSIAGIMYGFLRNLKSDLKSDIKKLKNEFKELREETRNKFKSFFQETNDNFREIHNDLKEIRTSLNRFEGAFYSQDCCLLKQSNKK